MTNETTAPREVANENAKARIPGQRYIQEKGYEAVQSASGRKSWDNGDDIAKALRGKDLETVYSEVLILVNKARDEGDDEMTAEELKAKYAHLNKGHQRMCLGNLARGAVKRMA